MLLTFLGPEIVLVLAFGQYYSAKASIVEFESLGYVKDATAGYDGWTLTHGFYADMGGIHVQPKPSCDWPKGWKSFPVDAKQLAWLVRHDYLQRSRDPDEPDYIRNISLRSIQARSKVDGLAKSVPSKIHPLDSLLIRSQVHHGSPDAQLLCDNVSTICYGTAYHHSRSDGVGEHIRLRRDILFLAQQADRC